MTDLLSSLFTSSILILITLTSFQDTYAQRRRYYRRSSSSPPGPNLCKVQHVSGTNKRFFSHCIAKHIKVICEAPTYERWECCPGFRRKGRETGCSEEKSLGSLMDTSKELDLKLFQSYVSNHPSLNIDLRFNGAYTLFAPSDEAIQEASESLRNSLGHPESDLLLYHVAPGRLNISSFRQKNHEFATLMDGRKVRINKYSFGIATVNCARIIRADELATNGIVHTIDKVISPSDMAVTLAERVFDDPQLSQFQIALLASGLLDKLKKRKRSITLLAPTDTAFAKLPNDVIDRILTDSDTAEKVIKRHMVQGVVCADAILVSVGLKTVEGERLMFRCTKSGIKVNHANVVDKDVVASNGVMHKLDRLLLPDSVKKASELMYDMHLDKFLDMARKAGLNHTLEEEDITVFTPNDMAFSRLPKQYLAALSKEPLKMERLVNYHIVRGHLTEDSLVGNSELNTITDAKIKVNIFRKGIRLDKTALKSYPRQCKNAVIHELDDVLIPHEETFIDMIDADPQLSKFSELFQAIDMGKMLSPHESYTLIAPTNRAFDRLEPRSWRRIVENEDRLRQFMFRHLIDRMVLKCSIPDKGVYSIESRYGDETEFKTDSRRRLVINKHSRTVSEDLLTANGILYKVDHVLPCSCERSLRTKYGQYISSHMYRRWG